MVLGGAKAVLAPPPLPDFPQSTLPVVLLLVDVLVGGTDDFGLLVCCYNINCEIRNFANALLQT